MCKFGKEGKKKKGKSRHSNSSLIRMSDLFSLDTIVLADSNPMYSHSFYGKWKGKTSSLFFQDPKSLERIESILPNLQTYWTLWRGYLFLSCCFITLVFTSFYSRFIWNSPFLLMGRGPITIVQVPAGQGDAIEGTKKAFLYNRLLLGEKKEKEKTNTKTENATISMHQH